jgi:hypothetical protein
MNRIPYITSVPPRLKRVSKDGADTGDAYQVRCVASWGNEGFDACSVNSRQEKVGCDIAVKRVDRDASEISGRPHVFLADLLAAGIEMAGDGPFVIGNADVILKSGIRARVARLQPGEILFSRRIDIDDMNTLEGEAHASGFDLFSITGFDAAHLVDTQLIFGAPWWDHYLPLRMHMKGGTLHLLEPVVFHLAHDERWNWSLWTKLGQTFLDEIEPGATSAYKAGLDAAKRAPWLGWRHFLRQNLIKPPTQEEKRMAVLHRVSQLNVRFVDEHATSGHT